MSSPKQSPASLRYLKARFRFLKRPAFWCSAVVLLLMALLAGEYFAHPEWLNTLAGGDTATDNDQAADSNTPATDVTLSPEELAAIGADIDSSAVLKQELEAFNVQPPANVPNQKSAAKSEGLFDQMAREQTASKTDGTSAGDLGYSRPNDAAKDKQKVTNPFIASAQELLNANLFRSGGNDAVSLLGRSSGAKQDNGESSSLLALSSYTPALGVSGFNSLSQNQNTTSATSTNYSQSLGANGFNSLNQNQSTTQISPLQAALNQVTQSSSVATTTTPTNALGQTLVPSTSTGLPALPSGVSSATNYIPQNPNVTNPANSYTNLTPPSAPSVPAAASVPTPLPSTNFVPYAPQSSGVPNPVFSSPYSNQEIRPGQLSQPANSSPSYFPRK